MQHAVAQQSETARPHRPAAEAEELVLDRRGNRQPQRPVVLRRDRFQQLRRQPARRQNRFGRDAVAAQAVQRLLDEAGRDRTSFHAACHNMARSATK
jgi:hypothetical protein